MDLNRFYASPVWVAVRDIIGGNDTPFKTKIEAILHTTEQDYQVMKVMSLDTIRDYAEMMMDNVLVKTMIPLGDYITLVYPNKDNLEMTISVTQLRSAGDAEDANKEISQMRYKVLFDPKNPTFSATQIANTNQRTLNIADIQEVRFRLMDRNSEPLRVKTVQGIFRGVYPEDLIKAILLGESKKILVDGSPAAEGIDVVPADNKTPISQVVISSGTQMCEVPTLLQENNTGVYKYGIGTYYQRFNNIPTWFVFPLYNHERFDQGNEQKIAIFYSAPEQVCKGVERTYRVNGNVLEVVTTSEKLMLDTTDLTQLNYGTGFRLPDRTAFMKKPILINDQNQPVGARGNLNQEVTFVDRGDGLNYVPTIRNINTNAYHETSQISARQTAIMKFVWENGNPDLIYPGMPMKYCFMQDDELVEIKGTILGVHSSRRKEGTFVESDRFSSNVVLSVATQLNARFPDYNPEHSYDP